MEIADDSVALAVMDQEGREDDTMLSAVEELLKSARRGSEKNVYTSERTEEGEEDATTTKGDTANRLPTITTIPATTTTEALADNTAATVDLPTAVAGKDIGPQAPSSSSLSSSQLMHQPSNAQTSINTNTAIIEGNEANADGTTMTKTKTTQPSPTELEQELEVELDEALEILAVPAALLPTEGVDGAPRRADQDTGQGQDNDQDMDITDGRGSRRDNNNGNDNNDNNNNNNGNRHDDPYGSDGNDGDGKGGDDGGDDDDNDDGDDYNAMIEWSYVQEPGPAQGPGLGPGLEPDPTSQGPLLLDSYERALVRRSKSRTLRRLLSFLGMLRRKAEEVRVVVQEADQESRAKLEQEYRTALRDLQVSTHTPCQNILSMCPVDTPYHYACQRTLSIHPLNPPLSTPRRVHIADSTTVWWAKLR